MAQLQRIKTIVFSEIGKKVKIMVMEVIVMLIILIIWGTIADAMILILHILDKKYRQK